MNGASRLSMSGLDAALYRGLSRGIVGLGSGLGGRAGPNKPRAPSISSLAESCAGRSSAWRSRPTSRTIHLVNLAQEGYVNGLAYGELRNGWPHSFLSYWRSSSAPFNPGRGSRPFRTSWRSVIRGPSR